MTSESVDALYERYGRSYLWLATFTGVLGGFFPALRAVRPKVVDALRSA